MGELSVGGIISCTKIMRLICVVGTSLIFMGCSEVRLNPVKDGPRNISSKGGFCISEPQAVERYTKFLFIVDKSGSNEAGNGGNLPPTDLGGVKRAGNIERFVLSNSGKDYIRYGMIEFNGTKAEPYITDGNRASFTDDINVVFQATNKIRNVRDEDATPYKAALVQARLAISGDMEAHPDEQSFYMIFFISDGAPTDLNNDGELDTLVDDIRSLSEGKIFLSTALYGDDLPRPRDILNRMAVRGGGKFINLVRSANWDFNDITVKPTAEPWQMKNLLVYNWNAGYCEDGSVDTDSDADGMCDKDEVKYGFNPANRFTFNDGYGDYFHWREVKYKESLPSCTDQSDLDIDGLTACEELYIRNDRPSPGIPRNGKAKNPDTDLDGVLDGIETFVYFTRSMAFAMDSLNLMRNNFDGEEPAGQQIFEHRNPLVRDAGKLAYDVTLTPEPQGNLDCYIFNQNTLPLYPTLEVPTSKTLPWLGHSAGANRVMLYYIQTPQSDPNGPGVYKYSVQSLLFGAPVKGLKVEDSVFETYVVPTSN